MNIEDRTRYDAKTSEAIEAWTYALEILGAWEHSARAIGSAELVEAMAEGEAYAWRKLHAAQDVLEEA